MNRRFILKRASTTFLAAIVMVGMISLGLSSAPVRAQVVAAGFAATLLKALPTIGTVIGNLFKPKTDANQTKKQDDTIRKMQKDSSDGMKQLGSYVKREQILATIVNASGSASGSVARMVQITAGQTTLTDSQVSELRTNLWPDVVEALDGIAKANPDTSVFDSDSLQILAINNILSADKALKEKIAAQLKYNPSKPDPTLLKNLQANLVELENRFNALRSVTAIELKIVADGLALVANSSQPNPKAVQDGAKKLTDSAFANSEILDNPVQKSMAAVKTSVKTQFQVR